MGKNKILKNLCINLSGRLRDNNVIKWSIKKFVNDERKNQKCFIVSL